VSDSAQPYIRYDNAQVHYSDLVQGLRGVSLTIERGEFLFLVGTTGAGKSTLLKLLTREVKESSGLVMLDGVNLTEMPDREVPLLRRRMGIVPQDFALLPRKRVWENVAYAMRAVGATRRQVRRRVPAILEMVNIGHRADAFPHQLSGGEQQRVAIARALINDPPLLLADEPTGNLDPQHSWEIMEILLRLNAHGATVLVASHDVMVVERTAKRIVTLEQGLVVSDVAPTICAEDGFVSPVNEPDADVAAEPPTEAPPGGDDGA
jgi:cell division transport system ATP-binding protein